MDCFKMIGILLGTTGAISMVVMSDRDENSDGNTDLKHVLGGSIMFYLNCSASVFYFILSRPAQRKYPSSTVTGYSYIVASVFMTVVAVIVALSDEILDFLCDDCEGPWRIPPVTIYALIYWVFIQTVVAYLLVTWANQYADPSVNCAYAVLQPMTAAVASWCLLFFGVIPNCENISSDSTLSCLYGPGIGYIGSVGICAGLLFVIFSDWKQKHIDDNGVSDTKSV